MTDTMTTADKAAMIIGGGFVVLGTVVLGTLEALIGNPSPVPVTNDAGQVVATTTFPVEVRAYLVALGLLIWLAYGVYRLATPLREGRTTAARTGTATE